MTQATSTIVTCPTERILHETADLRARLLQHEVYQRISDLDSLRVFMQDHVFAVLDFMWLLKRLQSSFCCQTVPWLPPANPSLARFVNEIVLGEETDSDGADGFCSHFELYLSAMAEIGAPADRIDSLTAALRDGRSLEDALAGSGAPEHVVRFVQFTHEIASSGAACDVASVFCFGREDVIPDMFQRLLEAFETSGMQIPRLSYYIRRHIELDGDQHGPLTRQMVRAVCQSEQDVESAIRAARTALEMRIQLWDGVVKTLSRTA
ncbi:MAG: DUF3050 domain-containing protein [Planctomycetaceae bacterium]